MEETAQKSLFSNLIPAVIRGHWGLFRQVIRSEFWDPSGETTPVTLHQLGLTWLRGRRLIGGGYRDRVSIILDNNFAFKSSLATKPGWNVMILKNCNSVNDLSWRQFFGIQNLGWAESGPGRAGLRNYLAVDGKQSGIFQVGIRSQIPDFIITNDYPFYQLIYGFETILSKEIYFLQCSLYIIMLKLMLMLMLNLWKL